MSSDSCSRGHYTIQFFYERAAEVDPIFIQRTCAFKNCSQNSVLYGAASFFSVIHFDGLGYQRC